MGINIKRQDVVDAVQELAKAKGMTMTDTIGELAMRELDWINRRKNLARDLRRIARETGPLFKEPWKSIDHGDLLYDKAGLPK